MITLWYAAFGSNMSRRRFASYLQGTTVERSTRSAPESGARDASLPRSEDILWLERELFFAHESRKWDGGGVAFIREAPGGRPTVFRLYKVTLEQFEDVHRQEAALDVGVSLDLDALLREGRVEQYQRLYGLALFLGWHDDGDPILTITSARENVQPNSPAEGYLATIVEGMLEFSQLRGDELAVYLADRINDERWDFDKIRELATVVADGMD